MRLLLSSFGSIGRRHLRNLQSLGCDNIIVKRSGNSTLPDDELADLPVVKTLAEGLSRQPSAVLICGPTAIHLDEAIQAADAGVHLFVEKPLSHSLDGVEKLQKIVSEKQLKVLVGFQFRFHPSLMMIERWLKEGLIGRVLSVQAHWGEYLPGWHPWENYRDGYSARSDMGGGVLLTLCHPFDYLRWLVGEVESVSASVGRTSSLGLDVEESADVLFEFKNGAVGNVHLDYLQKPAQHWLHIIGEGGTIHWDNSDGTARLYRKAASSPETYTPPPEFERNTLFLDEMKHFLACLDGRESERCSLEDGIQALKIVVAAKQAAASGSRVSL